MSDEIDYTLKKLRTPLGTQLNGVFLFTEVDWLDEGLVLKTSKPCKSGSGVRVSPLPLRFIGDNLPAQTGKKPNTVGGV